MKGPAGWRPGGWSFLGAAIVVDVIGAILLREANGLARPELLAAAYLLWVASIGLLGTSLRSLPLSVGYPVFIGLGSVGVYLWALVGYGEAMPLAALVGLALVILGTVLVSDQSDDGPDVRSDPQPNDLPAEG